MQSVQKYCIEFGLFLNAINLKDFCRISNLKVKCVISAALETPNRIEKSMIVIKKFSLNTPLSVIGQTNKQHRPNSRHWLSRCCCCRAGHYVQTNNESTTESNCLDFPGKSTYECFTSCLCKVIWDWRNY